jgi:histidinol dehydrogenase
VAQAVFITPDEMLLNAVEAAIEKHLSELPKAEIAKTSIQNRGALVLVKDRAEAIDLINQVAPEHLELCLDDAELMSQEIRHAGAIFMGRYTPEAIGDYCAGPNHVLPTSGTARFSSPLGVYDFQKKSSLIRVSDKGANTLGKVAATLADGEGLQAHAESARYRIDN